MLALPTTHALLNLDGTRNQFFVFGSLAAGYDSNIFSSGDAEGDYTVTGTFGAELKRRAGIIAVNGSVTFSYIAYDKNVEENAFNPNFFVEFNKTTGRTTGALTISAYKESRSDSSVNIRTSSWNLPIGLNLKYPVNDRYYLTSQTSYLGRKYVENDALANYADVTQSVDVFYIYTSRLDLLGGYRIRFAQTSHGDETTDHWINVGATGSLLAKLNGTVRLGYQLRDVSGNASEEYTHFNMLASLSWPVTRKLILNAQLSRDFNTIATGETVDSFSAHLGATYVMNRKVDFTAGLGYGINHFLGTPPPIREDTFFSFDVGARYSMNEHFKVGASYTYYRNWSTLDYSDFERQGFAIDISSRY
jgi:hypothetical protein